MWTQSWWLRCNILISEETNGAWLSHFCSCCHRLWSPCFQGLTWPHAESWGRASWIAFISQHLTWYSLETSRLHYRVSIGSPQNSFRWRWSLYFYVLSANCLLQTPVAGNFCLRFGSILCLLEILTLKPHGSECPKQKLSNSLQMCVLSQFLNLCVPSCSFRGSPWPAPLIGLSPLFSFLDTIAQVYDCSGFCPTMTKMHGKKHFKEEVVYFGSQFGKVQSLLVRKAR